eukprot:SAG11_NODE_529_length_8721_cov_24.489330_7_plen_253_part_00
MVNRLIQNHATIARSHLLLFPPLPSLLTPPCGFEDSNDRCPHMCSKCATSQRLGCDGLSGVVGTVPVVDECGVCGGSGTTCASCADSVAQLCTRAVHVMAELGSASGAACRATIGAMPATRAVVDGSVFAAADCEAVLPAYAVSRFHSEALCVESVLSSRVECEGTSISTSGDACMLRRHALTNETWVAAADCDGAPFQRSARGAGKMRGATAWPLRSTYLSLFLYLRFFFFKFEFYLGPTNSARASMSTWT